MASQGITAPHAHVTPDFVVFAATWDAAIERLADQIYNGEVKPTDLDKDLVLKNYAAFNKEAQKAWGKGYYDESLTRDFRENFLKFSGAKSYDLMKQLDGLNTKNTTKEDYIKQAKGIVQRHNEAYLQTELKFCGDVVSSAQEYAGYLADIDIYQNLKYRTMGDSEVRDSHAANEGIVKPVREWKQLPPYDFGCRCWLEQTLEAPTSDRKLKGIKFSNNPYQTGDVFNDQQSYFQNITDKKVNRLVSDNAESMKKYMPYNRSLKVGDQKVFINDFYDTVDGEASINSAKLMAKELAKDIYILPHIENSDKTALKNPEIGIGKPGTLADLKSWDVKKTRSTEKFVKNNVYAANKQGCEWVILDLTKAIENNPIAIAGRKLHGDLSDASKMNTGIKQVVIIRGKNVVKVSRKQINSKNFMQYFKLN